MIPDSIDRFVMGLLVVLTAGTLVFVNWVLDPEGRSQWRGKHRTKRNATTAAGGRSTAAAAVAEAE